MLEPKKPLPGTVDKIFRGLLPVTSCVINFGDCFACTPRSFPIWELPALRNFFYVIQLLTYWRAWWYGLIHLVPFLSVAAQQVCTLLRGFFYSLTRLHILKERNLRFIE